MNGEDGEGPLLIQCDFCVTPQQRINNAAILVLDGTVQAFGGLSAFTDLDDIEIISMPGCYAAPGFVDTHLYGAGGFDCMHADTQPDATQMSIALAAHGVTKFVPTTQSASPEKLFAVVSALGELCEKGDSLPGAVPVGIHMDGPFINPVKGGAHPAKHIRPIDLEEMQALLDEARGWIKIVTFAPELEDAVPLTELLVANGVVAAMGHTLATQHQVQAVIDAGATRCAHLYNGMEPLRQRSLGLAAMAMMNDDIWVEIIPDGIHIHPGMIDLACRCKEHEKIVCISNSNEAAGLHRDGVFRLGDEHIEITDGIARLKGRADVIAGSVNCLDENFRALGKFSSLGLEEGIACAGRNAAFSIGLHDAGEIRPGKRADLVVLDHDHRVQMTMINGKIVYRREAE
jgi:N-acetylglucosamine-6-phosphate deacetylase